MVFVLHREDLTATLEDFAGEKDCLVNVVPGKGDYGGGRGIEGLGVRGWCSGVAMKEAAWFTGSGGKMEADQVRPSRLSQRASGTDSGGTSGRKTMLWHLSSLHADDVRWASQIATRCALPIVPVGAGTAPDDGSGARRNAVQIRFDLMSGTNLSKDDEEWIEAEPGRLAQLDNELRRRGGLAVYRAPPRHRGRLACHRRHRRRLLRVRQALRERYLRRGRARRRDARDRSDELAAISGR